jgi:hypothetical protein
MAKVAKVEQTTGIKDVGDPLATLFVAVVRQAISDVQKGRNCAEEARQFLDHVCPSWAGWVGYESKESRSGITHGV